jgi:hypothetical protein
MRLLPHFPLQIPCEALCLRLIYLLPNYGPREDVLVPIDWQHVPTPAVAEAFLRVVRKVTGAAGARLETEDGGYIRAIYRDRG